MTNNLSQVTCFHPPCPAPYRDTSVQGLEPTLFLELLRVLRRWLIDPYPGQAGSLSPKESVLLCQVGGDQGCQVEGGGW